MSDLPSSSSAKRVYRMTKRAAQAAATRAQILEAVRVLVGERRFHDVSIDELADRAGVSRVTIYRTFGTKSALLEALTWDNLAKARLDALDAAHALPDARDAVRAVLRENCRMFADLGDALPMSLELARSDEDVARIVDATYHGRRHQSMSVLAGRIVKGHARARGWSKERITDALLVLTSFEAFDTLTRKRGRTPSSAADVLVSLAGAFLADE